VLTFSIANGRLGLKRRLALGAAVLLAAALTAWPWAVPLARHAGRVGAREWGGAHESLPVAPHLAECRQAIAEHRFNDAVHAVDCALAIEPHRAESLLLRGQLMVLRKDFAGARVELLRYLQEHPRQEEMVEAVHDLYDLCNRTRAGDVNNLLAMAAIFERMHLPDLAVGLLRQHGGFSLTVQRRLRELGR
jgi:hypothetical protein